MREFFKILRAIISSCSQITNGMRRQRWVIICHFGGFNDDEVGEVA